LRSWLRTASNASSWKPRREAVQDAGGETELLSLKLGEIQARNNDLDSAGTFTVDRMVADASVNDYDALLLPGGTVNPDKLRIGGRHRRESDLQSVTRRSARILQSHSR
jgi:putative intracellular protease/amidase